MGVLTLQRLSEIAKHELGSEPGSPIELREMANMAGEHLMGARQWVWAEGREVRLRPRKQIALAAATWTEATKRLTLTGAFADYSPLSGDTVVVDAGDDATLGTYEVTARVDADSITLATSIGSAADGDTDIGGVLPNDQIALPADFTFQGITAYAMTNGLISEMETVSPLDMLRFRSLGTTGSLIGFWALLRHVRSNSGGQPIPRLELYPRADDDAESLVIYYRAGWLEPATDDEVLSIPVWLNSLYIEMFKAVVNAQDEPENGTMDERWTKLRSGVLWLDAVRLDATMQPDVGCTTGTWLGYGGRGYGVGRYDVPPPLIPT